MALISSAYCPHTTNWVATYFQPPPPIRRPSLADFAESVCRIVGFLNLADLFCRIWDFAASFCRMLGSGSSETVGPSYPPDTSKNMISVSWVRCTRPGGCLVRRSDMWHPNHVSAPEACGPTGHIRDKAFVGGGGVRQKSVPFSVDVKGPPPHLCCGCWGSALHWSVVATGPWGRSPPAPGRTFLKDTNGFIFSFR